MLLKRAAASRLSGEWNEDDYDVLANGDVVGRILKVHAAPVGTPWLWTLAYVHLEDRTPTHGYEPTREHAMATFAKSWRVGPSAVLWVASISVQTVVATGKLAQFLATRRGIAKVRAPIAVNADDAPEGLPHC